VTLPGLLFVQGLGQALAWVLVYTAVSVVACGVGPGLMMTMTPQHLRGRIYAIYIAGVVLAATLWPTLIGILSDRVFNGPRGLLLAFCTVVIPCSFVAPVMLIKILEPFRRTIESTTKVAPTVSGSH
jgi:MFS family permease